MHHVSTITVIVGLLAFIVGMGTGLFALFFIALIAHRRDIFRKAPKQTNP